MNADERHVNRIDHGTELLVVQGSNRGELTKQLRWLASYLETHPTTSLAGLAARLNGVLDSNATRVSIVAPSVSGALQRVHRAIERLSDAECHLIWDVSGIYFAERQLYPDGKIAFLYPGEGAQYQGMLSDLWERFGEVRQFVEQCDKVADHLGGPARALSRFVSFEADAEVRARLENELRQLGNAMYAVLTADGAILAVLQALGLQPDVSAGHSIGELGALWFGGAIGSPGGLTEIVHTIAALEEQDGFADAVLLAVGTSCETAQQIIDIATAENTGSPAAFVAMDNCPHQTIIVGWAEAMRLVEQQVRARKLVCERLQLQRPYHTPLFEPFSRAIGESFGGLRFQIPHSTIYSCTTALPFPRDANEACRLAIAHWSSRVEFRRLIENMHADGARLFVEVGPRGNLTAFVQDILRGKSFAAIATDVPRRRGTTQLNHAAGQLVAHGVPLRLDHLLAGRDVKPVDLPAEPADGVQMSPVAGQRTDPQHASMPPGCPPQRSERHRVMAEFLKTMHRFLDAQAHVMTAYARVAGRTGGPPQSVALTRDRADSRAAALPVRDDRLPMLGTIEKLNPGRSIELIRQFDLDEDLYALDHTVGGRQVSSVDPDQHGLPVVPMTFTLEMMAEAATTLVPGNVVTGLHDIQLFRWLRVDQSAPRRIRLVGRILPPVSADSVQHLRVGVEVSELAQPGDGSKEPSHSLAKGTVLLAAQRERVNQATPPLPNARRCQLTLDELYNNLFHGARFQGVQALMRIADQQIEARIVVLPKNALFRSVPDPQLLLDPVTVDVAMQCLAGWHLCQPDQTGRVMLPFELKRLDFFGPNPPVGSQLRCYGRCDSISSRQFVHSLSVINSDGQLWCRMEGLKVWRFYLPFGDVNFHGPKDIYYLSSDWPLVTDMANAEPAEQRVHAVILQPPKDLLQPAIQAALARVTLSPGELQHFEQLAGKKQTDWIFGRIAAKDAVRKLWQQTGGNRLFMADIEILADETGRPITRPRDPKCAQPFPQVSLSRSDGWTAAIAASNGPIGIDLERIAPREDSFERIAFDQRERELLDTCQGDRDEWISRFWCAKEAVAKAVGRGLSYGPATARVRGADPGSGTLHLELDRRLAAEFPAWRGAILVALTARDDDKVVAVTQCRCATRMQVSRRPGRLGRPVKRA